MFNLHGRNVIIGWLAVGTLLAGCQPDISSTAGRTVEHAMGRSQVPTKPQRVVVLDTAPLDAVLALGIKPVGTVVSGQLPDYLDNRVEGIEPVGKTAQPNLETVSKIKPDLILGSKISHEKLYGQLSQIAPTVLTEGSGRENDWQKNLRLYARALDRPEQAEQLLQEYEQKVQQLKAILVRPQALETTCRIRPNNIIRDDQNRNF
ncbi:MAG: iron-siderophore ABC transporter substrate-binding protein [Cyanobacteria bacterium J06636_28]